MKKLLLTLALIIPLMFITCEKDTSINDDITIEQITNDVILSVDNAAILADNSLLKSATIETTCPIIRFHHPDTALFPKTIVINYGVSCTDSLGNVKSGRIFTVVSGPRNKVGSTMITKFNDFYRNGVKVEGRKLAIVKKVTENQITILFKFQLKLIFPDGKVIQRSGEKIKVVKR